MNNIELVNKTCLQNERPAVSFLIGAGFSAPMGYPIGNKLNEKLQYFDKEPVCFSYDGKLCVNTAPDNAELFVGCIYQKFFQFCKRVISKYARSVEWFDYERFYDFIRSKGIFEHQYKELCEDLLTESYTYESYVNGIIPIFNQMVDYLIKDNDGNSWYDGTPNHIGPVEHYDALLKKIHKWSEDHMVYIHTLNHDLLFESFTKTEYLNGLLSDGFDEYGSGYYGEVLIGKHDSPRRYTVKLQRYTGRYTTPVRLYKLHGSLDYALYYRTIDSISYPDRYVKLRQDVSIDTLKRSLGSKMRYEEFPFNYHADFLTGTTTKIMRYQEPHYKKIFKLFRSNLRKSYKLVVIGYGGKDTKINQMIIDNFDYKHKDVIFIDIKPSTDLLKFANKLNAKVLQKSIDDLNIDDI